MGGEVGEGDDPLAGHRTLPEGARGGGEAGRQIAAEIGGLRRLDLPAGGGAVETRRGDRAARKSARTGAEPDRRRFLGSEAVESVGRFRLRAREERLRSAAVAHRQGRVDDEGRRLRPSGDRGRGSLRLERGAGESERDPRHEQAAHGEEQDLPQAQAVRFLPLRAEHEFDGPEWERLRPAPVEEVHEDRHRERGEAPQVGGVGEDQPPHQADPSRRESSSSRTRSGARSVATCT